MFLGRYITTYLCMQRAPSPCQRLRYSSRQASRTPRTRTGGAPVQTFELAELLAARARVGELYHECVRVPALSAGVYVLPAGGADPQQPHSEDELYYVVRGRGSIVVEGERQPVAAGSLVFLPAQADHRLVGIAGGLGVVVRFSPAGSTGAP